MRLAMAFACMVLFTGCRTHATGKVLRRGGLECVRMERSNAPSSPSQWWEVRVHGKAFSVPGLPHSSDCDVSPNPSVEALVFRVQSLALQGGKPVLFDLNNRDGATEPQIGIWACNGHCLFYRHGYVWIERGEFHPIPKLAGRPMTVSPDLEAAVVEGTVAREAQTVSFCVADLKVRTSRRWTVSLARFPWLTGCESPGRDGSCREGRGTHFKWARSAAGRDELSYPSESEALHVEATSWETCGPENRPVP